MTQTLNQLKRAYFALVRDIENDEYLLKSERQHKKEKMERELEMQIQTMKKNHQKVVKPLEELQENALYAWVADKNNKEKRKMYTRENTKCIRVKKAQRLTLNMFIKKENERIEDTIGKMYIEHYDTEGALFRKLIQRSKAWEACEDKKWTEMKRLNSHGITREKLDGPMEDVCGICMESHVMRDTVGTCCEHQFGETCYETWTNHCKQTRTVMSCPMCKKSKPKIHYFHEEDKPVKPAAKKAAKKPVRGKGAIGEAEYLLAIRQWNEKSDDKVIKLKKPVRGKGAIGEAEYLLALSRIAVV
jgi:hypothetical protein